MKTVRQAVIDLRARWSVDSGNSDGYFISGDQLFICHKYKSLPYIDGTQELVSINVSVCNEYQFKAEVEKLALEAAQSINKAEYVSGLQGGNEVARHVIETSNIREVLEKALEKEWPLFVINDNCPSVDFTGLNPEVGVYHMPENNQLNNLPAAGSEIEVFADGEEVRAIHVVWSGDNVVFGYDLNAPFIYAHFSALDYKFRPIKTDCQKFIESAIDASIVDNGVPVSVVPYMNEIFERMFHAGFKSPE